MNRDQGFCERFDRRALSPDQRNVDTWAPFDEQSIKKVDRRRQFIRGKLAVTLYMAGKTAKEVLDRTKLSAKAVLKKVRRCLSPHPDGEIWGWRALVPGARVKPYTREKPANPGQRYGFSGAFTQLLLRYPSLRTTIGTSVFGADGELGKTDLDFGDVFKGFIDACRALDIKKTEYPFCADRMGYVSLWRYVQNLLHDNFDLAAKQLYGEAAVRKLRTSGGEDRPDLDVFQRVEFDAYKVDGLFTLLVPMPKGPAERKLLPRFWVLVILEVVSRAVLGYHICFAQEYNTWDILQTIRNALTKWTPRESGIKRLEYAAGACLPSAHEKFQGALWEEFSLDGGGANRAILLEEKLAALEIDRLIINRRSPDDRPFIESYFKGLAERGVQRLPNNTGHSPKDPGRKNPERAAIELEMEPELYEDLVAVQLANYNVTPHTSLPAQRTPLERLFYLTQNKTLRKATPGQIKDLSYIRKEVTVRGNAGNGVRPYINFMKVRYRGLELGRAPRLIGKPISILINRTDLRTVHAFAPDGSPIGILTAAGDWGRYPHDLLTRQIANSQGFRRSRFFASTKDPVTAVREYLQHKAQKCKRLPSNYCRKEMEARARQRRKPLRAKKPSTVKPSGLSQGLAARPFSRRPGLVG
jgi:hypothetical protein